MNDTWYEIYLAPASLGAAFDALSDPRPRKHYYTPTAARLSPTQPRPTSFGSQLAVTTDMILDGEMDTDEDMSNYLDGLQQRPNREVRFDRYGMAQIGSMYLVVQPRAERDPAYACLSFFATSWSMGFVFYNSQNIQDMFANIALLSGGVCCAWTMASMDDIQVCWYHGRAVDPIQAVRGASRPLISTVAVAARGWRGAAENSPLDQNRIQNDP